MHAGSDRGCSYHDLGTKRGEFHVQKCQRSTMTPRANAKRRKTTAIVRAQTQALGMVLLRMVVQTRSAKYAKDSQCSGGGTPDLFLKDLPSPNHRKQSRLAGLTLLAWDQDHDENNGHAERKPPLDDIFRWHITHSYTYTSMVWYLCYIIYGRQTVARKMTWKALIGARFTSHVLTFRLGLDSGFWRPQRSY